MEDEQKPLFSEHPLTSRLRVAPGADRVEATGAAQDWPFFLLLFFFFPLCLFLSPLLDPSFPLLACGYHLPQTHFQHAMVFTLEPQHVCIFLFLLG